MTRLRGMLWLVVGLLIAIVAGFIAYVSLARVTLQENSGGALGSRITVVVASKMIPVGTVITEDDIRLEKMPVKLAPENALEHIVDAVGKLALTDIYPGEVLLLPKLTNPDIVSGNGRVAAVVASDHVLMALPTADLMSNVGLLKPGDQIDLLFTLNVPATETNQTVTEENGKVVLQASPQQEVRQATFVGLDQATIAAIVGPNAPTTQPEGGGNVFGGSNTGASGGNANAILLSVTPQDALTIKYLKDAGAIFDIVLRSPTNQRPSETNPVDMDYIIDRYQISPH